MKQSNSSPDGHGNGNEEDDRVDEPTPPDSPYLANFGINAGWVEEVEDQYRVDPCSVDESWSSEFGGPVDSPAVRANVLGEAVPARQPALVAPASASHAPVSAVAPAPAQASAASPAMPGPVAPMVSSPNLTDSSGRRGELPNGVFDDGTSLPASPFGPTEHSTLLHIADKHARVLRLIHSYRARGHRIAQSDPLGGQSTYFPELDPAHYGFGNETLDEPCIAGDLPGGSVQTLRQILTRLGKTYCGPIGVEFTHVQDPGRKAWLRELMEEGQNHPNLDDGERHRILEKLAAAELFENFLHTKFLGQKRFSLEGGESSRTRLPLALRKSSSEWRIVVA